ncbi:Component of the SF3b subcomplex of the U2 snRNP [Friedmanniomyces endolithicus]|uniref:Component of the SF3b subcomplex of the U2 snRNP n=1 Tax=Friedmanniomyces endolithicus TaxID=329885 RepID=A0AAN6FWI4_9PEZI|nr:Component of the SF3b subcomplex of the U2 snRNP [Friedmanniomyces endolithicus]
MPAIRSAKTRKPPPDGFDDIEDTLLEFSNKMKDAENASHEGRKKHEMQWPIFQITHQRSRYIYDMYYEKEAITKQLYDWLLKNGYADATLIAKWKKQGYEKNDEMLTATPSCAAFGAFRLRRPTSTALASAVCHASS